MSREVLQQALEALENINNWLPTIGQKGLRDYEADAITAIKDALAQPVQPAHAPTYSELDIIASDLQALCDRQALRLGALEAQPEQMARLGWQYVECPVCGSEGARAFPKPEPEQEPVAKVVSSGEYDFPMLQWLSANHSLDTAIGSLLYTSPPQRQPLTGDEIQELRINQEFDRWGISENVFKHVARAIEAKLKEKNT